LAHGYRTLQHWNQWLSQQFLGKKVLETEEQQLSSMLERHFGKHALLIGVPSQHRLLQSTNIACHSLLSPLVSKEKIETYIESDFHELPILTGSIDLVILPHTLEFIDNPRQLLAEACRIIKPEGLIVINGFNPNSSWGLRHLFVKHKKSVPWGGNFTHPKKIKTWLKLADFQMEQHRYILYRPPMNYPKLYQKFHFLETIGSVCFPRWGGVYSIIARAKVIPLTPIRTKWKQQLSGIRISTSISGHIARLSK